MESEMKLRMQGESSPGGLSQTPDGGSEEVAVEVVLAESNMDVGDSVVCIECDVCEFEFPQHLMTNYGTRDHPKWRDRQCLAAARWYDKILVSRGEAPGDMKKNNPNKYNRKVFALRIMHKDDPEPLKCACKVKSLADRKKKMNEIDEVEAKEKEIEESEPVKYFNRDQWIAHQVQMLKTKTEAETSWVAVETDPNIQPRKNRNNEDTYPMSMPLEVSRKKRRITGEYLHKKSQPDDSDDEAEWLLSMQKRIADDVHMPEAMPSSGVANPFVSGGAFCEPVKVATPKSKGGALTSENLQHHDDQMSDVQSVSSGRSGASALGCAVFGMIPTSLTDARANVAHTEKQLTSKGFKNKSSAFSVVTALVAKMGAEHVEVVALKAPEQLATHKQTIDKMIGLAAVRNVWTESFQEKYTEFMAVVAELVKSDEALKVVQGKLKAINNTAVKSSTNDSRNVSLKTRQLTKNLPLPPQGFPNTILTWFGETVLGLSGSNEFVEGKTSAAIKPSDADEMADYQSIQVWKKSSGSKLLAGFVESLESFSIDAATKALTGDFNAPRKQTLPTNMAMIPARGKDATLLPATFIQSDSKVKVANSSGVFGPWLFGTQKFGFRCAASMIPFDALPSFHYVTSGSVIVLALPISTLLKQGSSCKTVRSTLSGLTPVEAKRFMESNCSFATIHTGELMFIPPGYVSWYVGLGDGHNFSVHVPVLSDGLYSELPVQVREAISENIEMMLDSPVSQKTWAKIAPTIKRWLHSE